MFITLLVIFLLLAIVALRQYYLSNYRRMIIKDGKPVGNDLCDYLERPSRSFTFYDPDKGVNWNPMQYFLADNKNSTVDYAKKWKGHTEEINFLMKWNNIEPDQKYADDGIFHFRCSDSPFDKDISYTLLPKEYYYFVTETLNNQGVKKLYTVTNFVHFRFKSDLANTKCPQYLDTILDWIEEKANFEVIRKPLMLDVKESYRAFLGSKSLVNNNSSFSFIPGMLKGKNFITPSMLGDFAKKEFTIMIDNFEEEFKNLHKKVHWTMWDSFNCIPHSIDYEKFDYKNYRVIKQ